MQIMNEVLGNKLIVIPLLACILSQIIKVTVDTVHNRKFSFRYIVSTGGYA